MHTSCADGYCGGKLDLFCYLNYACRKSQIIAFFLILAISYCPLFLLDVYMAGGTTEKTPFEFPLSLFLLHYEV